MKYCETGLAWPGQLIANKIVFLNCVFWSMFEMIINSFTAFGLGGQQQQYPRGYGAYGNYPYGGSYGLDYNNGFGSEYGSAYGSNGYGSNGYGYGGLGNGYGGGGFQY